MAETPKSDPAADTWTGCENPLDELTKDSDIRGILDEKRGSAQEITEATRTELRALQKECHTLEAHDENISSALITLLRKKAEYDFNQEVADKHLVFDNPATQAHLGKKFAEHVSGEILDEGRYRDPKKWGGFYQRLRDDFFYAVGRTQRKRQDGDPEGNKITDDEADTLLKNLSTFNAFYAGKPETAFATAGVLASSSEAIQQRQDALKSLISEMKGHANFHAVPEAARREIEDIEAKFPSTHSLEALKSFEARVQKLQKNHNLVPVKPDEAAQKKEEVSAATEKKEVGFVEKTVCNLLLGIGVLDFLRGFGEKVYRTALDIVTKLANDGVIDDEETLFSYGILKNQNGQFEVSEVLISSNDAFLKERLQISEVDLRKKLLKTKLKDFLADNETALEAYKSQIEVLKKVIKEKTEEKDRDQTLDKFLKNPDIRRTLIEAWKKLHDREPRQDSEGNAVADAAGGSEGASDSEKAVASNSERT